MIRFRAQNHPQQTKKNGAKDTVDDRWTPDDLFRELHSEFNFTLDVAATRRNAKCRRFFDKKRDGLKQSWAGHRVWCNPPYSDIEAWVRKAWKEVEHKGCRLAVLLLPNNRAEQGWWQNLIEPYRDRPESRLQTRFLARRRNFQTAHRRNGKFKTSSPFGLVVVVFA